MENFTGKFTKIILGVLFMASCLINVTALALLLLGIRPYRIQSGSMEPQYRKGDIVFINTRVSVDDLHIGDVIVYRSPSGVLVMHRLIGTDTMKGDANETSEHIHLTPSNFVGRASGI